MKLSKIGFGGYRIDNRVPEHSEALYKALSKGITVIDTSSNYSDGRSEILIGNVLEEFKNQNNFNRENLTLVTKVGYIQGQNLKYVQKRKLSDRPFSDVIEYEDALWYCISPDFIEDQVSRQLMRLNQINNGYIDVYLLHNPEYFLYNAQKNSLDKETSRAEFYERIKSTFKYLEELVSAGKIKSYGISSNCFTRDENQFEAVSLEKILEIASTISTSSHFKFIELPLNLLESDAILRKNLKQNTSSLIEFAKDNNIYVLTNRPLNAIDKSLIRLADFKFIEIPEEEIQRQMKFIILLESDLVNEKLPSANLNDEVKNTLKKYCNIGKTIAENWQKFGSIEYLNDNIEYYFSPMINDLLDFIDEKVSDANFKDSFEHYLKELFKTFNYIINFYKYCASKRSQIFHSILNDMISPRYHHLSLSQKVVLLITSIEGVSCTLVGMRKESYVDDILKVFEYEPIDNVENVFKRVKEEYLKLLLNK